MKIPVPTKFVSKTALANDQPVNATITGMHLVKSKWQNGQERTDYQLELLIGLEKQRISLYGANLLRLTESWGDDTEKWIGRMVRLRLESRLGKADSIRIDPVLTN